MRSPILVALLLPFALAEVSAAQGRRFPYRARVSVDEAYVRSGPGKRLYATSKLEHGREVVVHRHDPGGWYMIAPPEGSFSWIREEHVKATGGRTGIVRENNVVVRVGTVYGDVIDVEQRRLSKGDRVAILGRRTFRDDRGTIEMLKIAPPPGEYRWISGRHVVPVDRDNVIARNRDPYATPPGLEEACETPPADESPVPDPRTVVDDRAEGTRPRFGAYRERPLVRVREGDAIADHRPDPAIVARDRRRLHEIDLAFKDMIEREPTTWRLDALRTQYRDLQGEARHPSVTGAIPARLAAIERYSKVQAEYVDFVELTAGTSSRDAELVSMQRARRVPTVPADPNVDVDPAAAPPSSGDANATETTLVTLSGAGIVQRSIRETPGGPSHVLVAPTGRILALLQPSRPGVDLDAFLGRAAGVVGTRRPDPTLQADVIDVDELVPVRLGP